MRLGSREIVKHDKHELSKGVEILESKFRELELMLHLAEVEAASLRSINEKVESENVALKSRVEVLENTKGNLGEYKDYTGDDEDYCEDYDGIYDDEDYDDDDDCEDIVIDLDQIVATAERLLGQKVFGVVPMVVDEDELDDILRSLSSNVVGVVVT